MTGWIIAILVGAVVLPWLLTGGQIWLAFREQGISGGLGMWAGSALIPTIIVRGGYGLGGLIF